MCHLFDMDENKSVSEFDNALKNHDRILAYDPIENNPKNNQFENLRKLLMECKKKSINEIQHIYKDEFCLVLSVF